MKSSPLVGKRVNSSLHFHYLHTLADKYFAPDGTLESHYAHGERFPSAIYIRCVPLSLFSSSAFNRVQLVHADSTLPSLRLRSIVTGRV